MRNSSWRFILYTLVEVCTSHKWIFTVLVVSSTYYVVQNQPQPLILVLPPQSIFTWSTSFSSLTILISHILLLVTLTFNFIYCNHVNFYCILNSFTYRKCTLKAAYGLPQGISFQALVTNTKAIYKTSTSH